MFILQSKETITTKTSSPSQIKDEKRLFLNHLLGSILEGEITRIEARSKGKERQVVR